MEISHINYYPGTPFSVEAHTVQNGPGIWDSTRIDVCKDTVSSVQVIGSYLRNYSAFSNETFFPFVASDGNWYALYSANYTATRVMRLYDDRVEDWCGEDPSSVGFCPTEYYVPQFHVFHEKLQHGGPVNDITYHLVDNEFKSYKEFKDEANSPGFVSTNFCNFGFMSGCVWGDDSSWKLRYIDLSRIPDKILTIEERFGYHELPNKLDLKECIDMSNWDPNSQWLSLLKSVSVNLSQPYEE